MSLGRPENKRTISELDYVLLKKETNMKVVQAITDKSVFMCKMKFFLNGILGHGYGSSFRLHNGHLEKVDFKDLFDENEEKDEEGEIIEARDNRCLDDRRENQRLSKEDLHSLRKQGISGEGIVEHLVENSSTFQQKTEFSQQKYIKKKKKKHVIIFTVLRPSTRTLIEMYYSRGPTKICNLRMDSLAQILTQANIRFSSKTMVVESCSGLVIGAILERLAGNGAVIHLYTGSAPSRPALTEGYNFSAQYLQSLYSYPLDQVSKLKRPVSTAIPSSNILTMEESNVAKDITTDNVQPMLKSIAESNQSGENTDHKALTTNQQQTNLSDEVVSSELECPVMDVGSPTDDETNSDKTKTLTERENFTNEEATVIDDRGVGESSPIKQCPETKKGSKGNWKKRKFEDIEERERRKLERIAQIQKAKSLIEVANMDGLIVAAKLHPTPVVMSLIDFVRPSCPVVVFSPYKEPLMDCFAKLRERGGAVMIKLTETWFREYQVLTDRTHPAISMSGSGGYLLTATTTAIS